MSGDAKPKRNWQSEVGDEDEDRILGTGATLTQEQFNHELSREKKALRNKYIKLLENLNEELEAIKPEHARLSARAKLYDDHFSQILTEKKKDLPDWMLELLKPMAPEEQVAWLQANADKLAAAIKPKAPAETPKPAGERTPAKPDQLPNAQSAASKVHPSAKIF